MRGSRRIRPAQQRRQHRRRPGQQQGHRHSAQDAAQRIIALVLMASFASLSWPLAQLLLPGGWETLYFLVLELLALLVSVLAGALSSYNRLFQAKDNDLLLALPAVCAAGRQSSVSSQRSSAPPSNSKKTVSSEASPRTSAIEPARMSLPFLMMAT